jgi:hypothetical protein
LKGDLSKKIARNSVRKTEYLAILLGVLGEKFGKYRSRHQQNLSILPVKISSFIASLLKIGWDSKINSIAVSIWIRASAEAYRN